MARRIVSAVLTAVLLCSILPASILAAAGEAPSSPETTEEKIVRIPQNQEAILSAQADGQHLTWQIASDGQWVDVHDRTGAVCPVDYALAKNMLDEEKCCAVRCRSDQGTILAEYQVQFTASEIQREEFTPVFTMAADTAPQTALAMEASEQAAPVERPTAPGEPHLFTIEYRDEQGKQVLAPWTGVIKDTTSQTIYFPGVQGYAPYVDCTFDGAAQKWIGGTQQTQITIDSANITEDVCINVIYKATEVNYLIQRHFQQVNKEHYEVQTEAGTGLTGTQVDMEALATEQPGFTAMWYDEPCILANGKTVVDIYYDRLYYLMKFDLGGGYGVEPIYAQFASPITVAVPTKPGYRFLGWADCADTSETITDLPATMPAKATSYKAMWQAEATADVTVMIWGENPDQPGTYAYRESIGITAPTGSTVDVAASFLTCQKMEHQHHPGCYQTPCNKSYHPRNPKHGDRHTHGALFWKQQCIYDAQRKGWFQTDGGPACGLQEHVHTEDCSAHHMDPSLWTFVKQDHPIVQPDGTTVVNAYYDRTSFTMHFRDIHSNQDDFGTITAKWGTHIQQQFGAVSAEAATNNWSESDNGDSPWTANVQIMPAVDKFYYRPPSEYGTSTAYYKGLQPDGKEDNKADYTVELLTSVVNGTGLVISQEDFLEFDGFTINPALSARKGDPFNNAEFYYMRNPYHLDYHSGGAVVRTERVPFEKALSSYGNYIPPYPDHLEKNAYQFEGWYADPGFLPECKIDWYGANFIMPAANMSVYAHWIPVEHTVRTYACEQDLLGGAAPLESLTAAHGSLANLTVYPNHEALKQQFVGWFYRDDAGQEVAFDEENMPVQRDLNLYAKWSSKSMVEFVVKYEVKNRDGTVTEIAAPLTGKIMAGTQKTFYPKTGLELYAGYRAKYYPVEGHKTVTMHPNSQTPNMVLFYYEYREAPISYTIQYLEKGTNRELHAPHTDQTTEARLYADFIPITGYVPDAYTKVLSVSPYEVSNVLTFWYTKDTHRAPMRFTQWLQKTDGSGYEIYRDDVDRIGAIGQHYTIELLTIPGFVENTANSNRRIAGTLTAEGLHLQRFYDRISYPYEIRFLEEGTQQPIPNANDTGSVAPARGTALLGAEVLCVPQEIQGWQCVNPQPYPLSIGIEPDTAAAKNNIYTFYYRKNEQEVDLTIRKAGWQTIDENQSFLFHIQGTEPATSAVDLTVSIVGNGSTTITQLPPGQYSIREKTDWSWRYTPAQTIYSLELIQDQILDVHNTRTNITWLNGMAWQPNNWARKKETPDP